MCLGEFTSPPLGPADTLPTRTWGPVGVLGGTSPLSFGQLAEIHVSAESTPSLSLHWMSLYFPSDVPEGDCLKAWKNVRDDFYRHSDFPPGGIRPGKTVALMTGCLGAPRATGECGASAPDFGVRAAQVAAVPLGGRKDARYVQYVHATPAPRLADVQVYVQEGKSLSSLQAVSPDGVFFGYVAATAVPVVLDVALDPALMFVPRTTVPCMIESDPGCRTYRYPLDDALSTLSGGWPEGSVRVLAVLGSPDASAPLAVRVVAIP